MKDKSIIIRVSRTFELEKAVCNHGFFMMAPNRWNPSSKTLVRPLRLPDQKSVTVSINLLCETFLQITVLDYVHHDISPSDHEAISVCVRTPLSMILDFYLFFISYIKSLCVCLYEGSSEENVKVVLRRRGTSQKIPDFTLRCSRKRVWLSIF